MTSEAPPPISRLASAEAVAAVVFGLIPIAGILLWGWSPFALIFLYWLENVLIGARTAASIVTAGLLHSPVSLLGASGLASFFALHYGLFCLVHGMFVVSMFGEGAGFAAGDPSNLIAVTTQLFAKQANLFIGFGSIVIWQLVEFIVFLIREASAARDVNMRVLRELMMAPYPRIVVLHITIIFGGFLLMATGWPIIGVLALALFKMAYDVACALGWSPLRRALALRGERA